MPNVRKVSNGWPARLVSRFETVLRPKSRDHLTGSKSFFVFTLKCLFLCISCLYLAYQGNFIETHILNRNRVKIERLMCEVFTSVKTSCEVEFWEVCLKKVPRQVYSDVALSPALLPDS